jgi:pyruvate dehydrogenase E2 component (dihydrolipoamide acetyltransferase)
MARELVMPKLGLTMTQGTVTKWYFNEGDRVKEGDILYEVETDKLTNKIAADTEGVLRKIFVHTGETVPVKSLLGIIGGEDEDISDLVNSAEKPDDKTEIETAEEAPAATEKEVTVNKGDYVLATPYAKKIAVERNIDLSKINPTGYKGVILAKDLDQYKETKIKATPTARKMAEQRGIDLADIYEGVRIRKSDILALEEKQGAVPDIEVQETSTMRKIIAQRLKSTWAGTPMVTFKMEADMTEFIALREKLKPIYLRDGLKLTYNHLIMKVLAKLLVKYRDLNASFEDDKIIYHNNVNLGIAVDVEGGLLVPNVKGIEKMTLREISSETEKLIENARTNQLNPDDLTGGTFTITNIGMFGMDSFTPIINKPEVAILGINKIADKAVVINKEITIRPIMNLSLTTDHSLVDGALSARFLKEIVDMIENPHLLL